MAKSYIFVRRGAVYDSARYEAYREQIVRLLPRFGGRYVVRGAEEEHLEGEFELRRDAVLEFGSPEERRRFWDSEEYARLKELRAGAVDVHVVALDGYEEPSEEEK
ncbi:uncharacterized protein (DUF1330 family) [Microbacterium resistens]|uniref:Uncharacterized protein (DUF1330 family) n=1 Tax=Microbacterium resistens TaxID=156977 RepID=A0ABU1SDE9_9MICO|nr:DUF1330 domain-containing protein [Microbacterium resistens]MDR6867604.1 uncharacterized protein (DUF1330 family) [Microbacterium resistens]